MERLAFGSGASRARQSAAGDGSGTHDDLTPPTDADARPARQPRAKTDWAFVGLMLFTGLLFLRPQDTFRPLGMLHLAELAALFALAALVGGRLSRNLPATRVTVELAAVLALAGIILMTAPFSIWMGGAVGTFTDMYAKVVLIFVLMINTLNSPKRLDQFTWLIVIASGYIGGRAVLDYARGVNLIEYGRVQGSVGGMFRNPNDLALNMVAALPLAAMFVIRPASRLRKVAAAVCVVLMAGAVVASQSRSGTVGLAGMAVVFAAFLIRQRPGLVGAAAVATLLVLPVLPSSYWERIASITNEELDQTGSREARSILLEEAVDAFIAHPITGVGAGQFTNYNPEGRQEAWREAHNSVLQVAAELGVFGLMVFVFLVWRGLYAPFQARRLLRSLSPSRRPAPAGPPLPPGEHEMLTTCTAAVAASLAGWFLCALFASVAYHWTFYYLLALAAAPRDYLLAHLAAGRSGASSPRAVAVAGAEA